MRAWVTSWIELVVVPLLRLAGWHKVRVRVFLA